MTTGRGRKRRVVRRPGPNADGRDRPGSAPDIVTDQAAWFATPLESEIQDAIRLALTACGYHVSTTSQRRKSGQTIGLPDLFACHPVHRRFAWLEVKRPGEQPTRSQREWHDTVRAAGCPVHVVHSAQEAIGVMANDNARGNP